MKKYLLATTLLMALAGSAQAITLDYQAIEKDRLALRDACIQAAEYSANYGTPKFLNRANAFMEPGPFDESNLSIMKWIERGVKFQDKNGAWVQVTVTCSFNWETHQVVGINLERGS